MPITLTDEDLPELQRLLDELRHRDAVPLINFFSGCQQRARLETMKAKTAAQLPPAPVVPSAEASQRMNGNATASAEPNIAQSP